MSYDFIKALAKQVNDLFLPSTHGSSDAYALAQAAQHLKQQGRLLTVLSPILAMLSVFCKEIPWFAQSLRCHLLPDWETLPYDAFRRIKTWSRNAWLRFTKSVPAIAMF